MRLAMRTVLSWLTMRSAARKKSDPDFARSAGQTRSRLRCRRAHIPIELGNVVLAQKPIGVFPCGNAAQPQLLRQAPLPGPKFRSLRPRACSECAGIIVMFSRAGHDPLASAAGDPRTRLPSAPDPEMRRTGVDVQQHVRKISATT